MVSNIGHIFNSGYSVCCYVCMFVANQRYDQANLIVKIQGNILQLPSYFYGKHLCLLIDKYYHICDPICPRSCTIYYDIRFDRSMWRCDILDCFCTISILICPYISNRTALDYLKYRNTHNPCVCGKFALTIQTLSFLYKFFSKTANYLGARLLCRSCSGSAYPVGVNCTICRAVKCAYVTKI